MNLLDVLVLLALASAALGGFRAGLLARVASWVGLGLGFYVGIRVAPSVLEAFGLPSAPARLLATLSVIILSAFIGQAIGLVIGHRIRAVLPIGGVRTADRAAGALAGGVSVLLSLWLLMPTLATVPGWAAQQTRNSSVVRALASVLPDPPNATQALGRLVDEHGIPDVFQALRPAPDAGAPPAVLAVPGDVLERVTPSTVKIHGEACGRIQEGSGFVALPDVVVTNAHVVAGEARPEVIRTDGKRFPATIAVFDAGRDLAVLRVPNLGRTPLPRAEASPGDEGAVFGHPNGQDALRIAPARISQEVTADGNDIYGNPTRRQVYVLASDLEPGDSGGALVDGTGAVVGVAFAIAPDRATVAYALTDGELEAALAAFQANPSASVGTTACI